MSNVDDAIMMVKMETIQRRFPVDCDMECKHYSEYDLSIDDIVCCCNLLGVEIDLCDVAFACLPYCPM